MQLECMLIESEENVIMLGPQLLVRLCNMEIVQAFGKSYIYCISLSFS